MGSGHVIRTIGGAVSAALLAMAGNGCDMVSGDAAPGATASAAATSEPAASDEAASATATATAAPKEPTADELLASKTPVVGSAGPTTTFGKPMWSSPVGTKQQLQVATPKGWEIPGGRYSGMSTMVAPDGVAMISMKGVYHHAFDTEKNAGGVEKEFVRWYKYMLSVELEPTAEVEAGPGKLPGVMQKGEGIKRSSKAGCMAPNAPESCKIEVHVVLFGVRKPKSFLVSGVVHKDAPEEVKLQFADAIRTIELVDAAAAKVKGVFPTEYSGGF